MRWTQQCWRLDNHLQYTPFLWSQATDESGTVLRYANMIQACSVAAFISDATSCHVASTRLGSIQPTSGTSGVPVASGLWLTSGTLRSYFFRGLLDVALLLGALVLLERRGL